MGEAPPAYETSISNNLEDKETEKKETSELKLSNQINRKREEEDNKKKEFQKFVETVVEEALRNHRPEAENTAIKAAGCQI